MQKNILVIDDEELIIKTLSKLLEKSGYAVLVAKNGKDAIAMVEEENFDLMIADIRMPGINGVETVQSINNILKTQKRPKIPVIFITGYTDEKIKENAFTLKPLSYIYKPFEIDELVNKVKEVLG